tara:strand:+ start:5165 stop:5521 length:357 start_codon:yes stop_codon:yes gene_type:complete
MMESTESGGPFGLRLSEGLGDDAEPPRRAGPKPVTTLEELQTLDEAALVRGYRAGLSNSADWTERERGYWHGYLNGMVDGGHAKTSREQAELAHEYVKRGGLRDDIRRWQGLPGDFGA